MTRSSTMQSPAGRALVPGFVELAQEIARTGSDCTAQTLQGKVTAMEARVRQQLAIRRIDAARVRAIVDLLPTLLAAKQVSGPTRFAALRTAYRRALELAAGTLSRAEYDVLKQLGDRLVQVRAWDLLSDHERGMIAGKIGHFGGAQADRFDELLRNMSVDLEDPVAIREGTMTVQNLYDGASGVWQWIARLDGGFGSAATGFSLVIAVSPGFLDALRKDGYQVDAVTEQAKRFEQLYKTYREKGWREAAGRVKQGKVLNGVHKHTARKVTETTAQPGLHFVQEDGYAEDRFDVHWDLHSTSCRKCTVKERIQAGGSHSLPAPASLIRSKIGRPLLCTPGN